jgi:hypothetical protein
MNKLARAAPWYAPWRSRAVAIDDDDPAGLGTAFGLDLSLQEPAATSHTPPPTPRKGWVPRWAARRKSPAT